MTARDDHPTLAHMEKHGLFNVHKQMAAALDEIDRLRNRITELEANQRPQLRLANEILAFTRDDGSLIQASAICSECASLRGAALEASVAEARRSPFWDGQKRMVPVERDLHWRCGCCGTEGRT